MALTDFKGKLIADIGISMGDEGKGRLIYEVIDELKAKTKRPDIAAIVMKINGGANSGHTAGGVKLNLLPAGVIEKDVETLAIGAGVVADPRKFLWEGIPLEKKGYEIFSRLLIDERALLSDVGHRLLDLAWENYRVEVLKEEPRGSTGRGITPSYLDEVGQFQIWYCDFLGTKEAFASKMRPRLERACDTIKYVCKVSEKKWGEFFDILTNAELRANAQSIEEGVFSKDEFDFHKFMGAKPFELDIETVVDAYWQAGQKLAKNVGDVRACCLGALSQNRYIVGEFGQSYWLDKRHGFPPNVTASHTSSPEFFQSAGIPVQPMHILGCCKAYDTKVGTHIFLTQMDDAHPLAVKLKKLEFGTSTGRQRMVGWFDAVEKGDALRYAGYDDIVINKLDALSYEGAWQEGGELLVCTSYRGSGGKIYRGVPRSDLIRKNIKPIYAQLPCWKEDISKIRSFGALPAEAKRYVAFCLKSILEVAGRDFGLMKTPNLRYIGVGPLQSQIIRDVPATQELLKLA
ncbi:MAG: adenylosuccinate synthetase [Opitutales bacterium]|nr:adenylosuccinate synthetase [Opitutales bacterium]